MFCHKYPPPPGPAPISYTPCRLVTITEVSGVVSYSSSPASTIITPNNEFSSIETLNTINGPQLQFLNSKNTEIYIFYVDIDYFYSYPTNLDGKFTLMKKTYDGPENNFIIF